MPKSPKQAIRGLLAREDGVSLQSCVLKSFFIL
jgi:hypothetical protein